jgi:phosphomannomutase
MEVSNMKYYVTYKIEARYIAEVEAENLEEAMEKAESEYIDADFGAAEDIDGEAIIVEDENGNYVWEK